MTDRPAPVTDRGLVEARLSMQGSWRSAAGDSLLGVAGILFVAAVGLAVLEPHTVRDHSGALALATLTAVALAIFATFLRQPRAAYLGVDEGGVRWRVEGGASGYVVLGGGPTLRAMLGVSAPSWLFMLAASGSPGAAARRLGGSLAEVSAVARAIRSRGAASARALPAHVERDLRSLDEWLSALRDGVGPTSAFRRPAGVDPVVLRAVLADGAADPDERAAAAALLVWHGEGAFVCESIGATTPPIVVVMADRAGAPLAPPLVAEARRFVET